jgi:hypothetical protein
VFALASIASVRTATATTREALFMNVFFDGADSADRVLFAL